MVVRGTRLTGTALLFLVIGGWGVSLLTLPLLTVAELVVALAVAGGGLGTGLEVTWGGLRTDGPRVPLTAALVSVVGGVAAVGLLQLAPV